MITRIRRWWRCRKCNYKGLYEPYCYHPRCIPDWGESYPKCVDVKNCPLERAGGEK